MQKPNLPVVVPVLLILLIAGLAGCRCEQPEPPGGEIQEGVLVEPSGEVQAGALLQWRLTYILSQDIAAGGEVRVLFPHSYYNNRPANLLPQLDHPGQPGFCTLTVNDAPAELRLSETALYPRHLIATAPATGWRQGDRLVFTLGVAGANGPGFQAPYAADEEFAPFLVIDPEADGSYEQPPHRGTVQVTPGPAVAAWLFAPATLGVGEEFSATLTVVDAYGNPTDQTPALEGELATVPPKLTGQRSVQAVPVDGFIRLSGLSFNAPGVYRLQLELAGGAGRVISNPVRVTDQAPARRLLWGDPHGHSTISDGARAPAAYYATAAGPAALDFAALTDHEWQIDQTEWSEMQAFCRQYESKTPAVLLGWEYSLGGHGIVYYPDCDAAPDIGEGGTRDLWQVALGGGQAVSWQQYQGAWRRDSGYKPELWEQVRRARAFFVPHTTATADMGDEADLDDPEVIPAVEVYSGHGSNFGTAGIDRVPNYASSGSVLEMLGRGRRFGLLAASDTHDSRPGLATWGRASQGLTAVWAATNDRKGVLAGIQAGHTYATTGHRSLIEFTVAGREPGARFASAEPLEIAWTIHGDGLLSKLEIWRNGAIWKTSDLGSAPDSVGLSSDDDHRGTAWYLLRVVMVDGGQAWTSPIFVDDPRALTIERFSAFDAGGVDEIVVRATPGEETLSVSLMQRHGDDGGPERQGYESVTELDLRSGPIDFRQPFEMAPGLTTYYLLEEVTPDGVRRHGPAALARFPEAEYENGIFQWAVWLHGGPALVEIHDLDGRLVRQLHPPAEAKGLFRMTWDGRDDQGKIVASPAFSRIVEGEFASRWRPLIRPASGEAQ